MVLVALATGLSIFAECDRSSSHQAIAPPTPTPNLPPSRKPAPSATVKPSGESFVSNGWIVKPSGESFIDTSETFVSNGATFISNGAIAQPSGATFVGNGATFVNTIAIAPFSIYLRPQRQLTLLASRQTANRPNLPNQSQSGFPLPRGTAREGFHRHTLRSAGTPLPAASPLGKGR